VAPGVAACPRQRQQGCWVRRPRGSSGRCQHGPRMGAGPERGPVTSSAAESPAGIGGPADTPPATGLVVLAVDDEAPALDEISFLLRGDPRVGTVLTAADAAGALKILQPNSPNPVPDAVLLDIAMPGWEGVDLARVLAALPRPPAVAFLSAHDDRAVEAYEIGALDYLLKPVRAARLAEAVTRFCAARDVAAEQDRRHFLAITASSIPVAAVPASPVPPVAAPAQQSPPPALAPPAAAPQRDEEALIALTSLPAPASSPGPPSAGRRPRGTTPGCTSRAVAAT